MKNFNLPKSVRLPGTVFSILEHLELGSKRELFKTWHAIIDQVEPYAVFDSKQRLELLLTWFKEQKYIASSPFCINAHLGGVITEKHGTSASLATLLLALGNHLHLKFEPLSFPANIILRITFDDGPIYVNPLSGNIIDRNDLLTILKGELGPFANLAPRYFYPINNKKVVARIFHELKAGSILEKKFDIAFKICNLLLQWFPSDHMLNRERAIAAENLGCVKLAKTDLEHFVKNSPNDPIVERIKRKISSLAYIKEVYH